jgi:uncharacterized protein (UPF0264 family)
MVTIPAFQSLPGLLVSVRSAAEARAAMGGGASLIDVKDPGRGSLGRASEPLIQAVIKDVAGRCPVSAALGEWRENPRPPAVTGLSYAKWGLSGCGQDADWERALAYAGRRLGAACPGCRPVAVAYADWERAQAPPPAALCAFAIANRWGAFLIDTWKKDCRTLLDWMPLAEVLRLCRRCGRAALPVALAGSLGAEEISFLLPARPNWFAVRGAVCRDGRREGAVSEAAVRRLNSILQSVEARVH